MGNCVNNFRIIIIFTIFHSYDYNIINIFDIKKTLCGNTESNVCKIKFSIDQERKSLFAYSNCTKKINKSKDWSDKNGSL